MAPPIFCCCVLARLALSRIWLSAKRKLRVANRLDRHEHYRSLVEALEEGEPELAQAAATQLSRRAPQPSLLL